LTRYLEKNRVNRSSTHSHLSCNVTKP